MARNEKRGFMEGVRESTEPTRPELELILNATKSKRGSRQEVSIHTLMLRVLAFFYRRPGANQELIKEAQRAVKEAREKSVSVELYWLVRLLNEGGSGSQAEERVAFLGMPFPEELVFTRADQKRLIQLRRELTDYLRPLVGVNASDSVEPLKRLVEKINSLELKAIWHIEPAEADWQLVVGKKVIAKGHWSSPVGYSRGVLKTASGKWAIRHDLEDRYAETHLTEGLADYLRKGFYGVVAAALEDGTLTKLGQCHECQRFFILDRLGMKYCSDGCMRAADVKRAATVRVPRHRQRERKARVRTAQLSAERSVLRRFFNFMRLASKNRHEDKELNQLKPILVELGEGQVIRGWKLVKEWERCHEGGVSLKGIWQDLPQRVKQIISGYGV